MHRPYLKWANQELISKGFHVIDPNPETIQKNPWAEVSRFRTNQGFIILKTTPGALFLETKIIDLLDKNFDASVPQIIAKNTEQNCFLMRDAGMRLFDYFKNHFQSDILIKIVKTYSILQIKTQNKINLFLDLGVPDWGLEKLPMLYQNLIMQEKLLLDDGLSKEELFTLKQLKSKLIDICGKLSQYKIINAFGNADFHDKNILIHPDSLKYTFIDLGEVVITHPFFSFHNCLYRSKLNFSLSDSQYQQIIYSCLDPWRALETQEHLSEILALIETCWPIHAVLGEWRLMNSVNHEEYIKLNRKGRFATRLQDWIKKLKGE